MRTQTIMDMKVIRTCSTKMSADDDSVETTLTIDYSGLTWGDVLEKAIRSDVITWQNGLRTSKTILKVPTEATYKSPKPGTRSVADPISATVSKFAGMSEDEQEALIAKLMALKK